MMKVEIKDLAFLVLGLIVSHYAEQLTFTVLGFSFFSGWLLVIFLFLYMLWMHSRERFKKKIKDEILKELGM